MLESIMELLPLVLRQLPPDLVLSLLPLLLLPLLLLVLLLLPLLVLLLLLH